MSKPVTYSDLFCGVGGFSLSLEMACKDLGLTCQCVYAADKDKKAVETFNRNFSHKAVEQDIRKLTSLPEHDIMFGGFPCQPFSRNNKRYRAGSKEEDWAGKEVSEDTDDRVNLFEELVRLLRTAQPKYFIFENVKGLTEVKHGESGKPMIDLICTQLIESGYDVKYKVLNAFDFGIPQQRRRVIFVGIRKDLRQIFEFPLGKKSRKKSTPCIGDILETKKQSDFLIENLWHKRKLILKRKEGACGPKPNFNIEKFPVGTLRSVVMKHLVDESEDFKSLTKSGVPDGKLHAVAIVGDTPSGMSRQADRVYHSLGISPTIATFGIPSVLTPHGIRQLTPVECARLQGFPAEHKLTYHQAGNAVCVCMIQAVIKSLLGENYMRKCSTCGVKGHDARNHDTYQKSAEKNTVQSSAPSADVKKVAIPYDVLTDEQKKELILRAYAF